MIKKYCVNYEQFDWYEGYVTKTTQHEIIIPAQNLFDAVDYCHNVLEIKNIKEVYEL